MKDSTVSLNPNVVRTALLAALAIGSLTALVGRAQAQGLDPITLSAPAIKTVGRDSSTGGPIETVTVTARIAADAGTLRNDSGVVLLNDRVVEAAHQACRSAAPFSSPSGACEREAVKSATPRVKAAIGQARASSAVK